MVAFPDYAETPVAPLMDLARVKELLGIPADNTTYDAQITFAIEVVSGLVVDYTGRRLVKATYVDEFPRPQRNIGLQEHAFFSLSEYPVESITSMITEMGAGVSPYSLHKRMGTVTVTGVGFSNGLTVTYIGGYDPLPADLQGVVLELIRRQLTAMGVDYSSAGGGAPPEAPVSSISVGQLKVSYAVSAKDASSGGIFSSSALDEFASVLDRYVHSNTLASVPT